MEQTATAIFNCDRMLCEIAGTISLFLWQLSKWCSWWVNGIGCWVNGYMPNWY